MTRSREEETIIAQCTPTGSGAIALLRLSGDDSLEVADRFAQLSSSQRLADVATHTIHHGHVIDEQGNQIDEVLFFVMKAPRSFTGQTTVEISCHNNQFIIQSIIQHAVRAGARIAQPGEFSRRAVLHGKLDVLKAEAINEVIHASNQEMLKASFAQLKGSLSQHINQIENEILLLLSHVEASFEFLDEEQRDLSFTATIQTKLEHVLSKVDALLEQYSLQDHLREGIRIALLGSVNAGKSTLFNGLLKKDRAIVSSTQGTTRDVLEGTLSKKAGSWLLVDTAGLRQTDDHVEQEGIRRSLEQARRADIVLLVLDVSEQLSDDMHREYVKLSTQFKDKTLVVISKCDESTTGIEDADTFFGQTCLRVSSHTGRGIKQLEEQIAARITKQFAHKSSAFLLNKRHHHVLTQVQTALRDVQQRMSTQIEAEILALHLRDILEIFGELTGRVVNEKMMDTIFHSFCVGK